VSIQDVGQQLFRSAISGGEGPAPLPVSRSVALVGTGLRAVCGECHRRHGWRTVGGANGPWRLGKTLIWLRRA